LPIAYVYFYFFLLVRIVKAARKHIGVVGILIYTLGATSIAGDGKAEYSKVSEFRTVKYITSFWFEIMNDIFTYV